MNVTEDGVPIQELIETIKQAIKTANISSIDLDRDLRVGSVQLTLNVVAIHSLGGGLDFRIPFIGMQVKVGSKLTKKDTHRIDISMVPPDFVRDMLPPDTEFTAFGASRSAFPMVAQAYLAGGHVRVGLEDAVYLSRGVLAETNAVMVEKARDIVKMLGGEAMSATEARAHLGLADTGRKTRSAA